MLDATERSDPPLARKLRFASITVTWTGALTSIRKLARSRATHAGIEFSSFCSLRIHDTLLHFLREMCLTRGHTHWASGTPPPASFCSSCQKTASRTYTKSTARSCRACESPTGLRAHKYTETVECLTRCSIRPMSATVNICASVRRSVYTPYVRVHPPSSFGHGRQEASRSLSSTTMLHSAQCGSFEAQQRQGFKLPSSTRNTWTASFNGPPVVAVKTKLADLICATCVYKPPP